ncbi:MAG: hypothetical protein JNJ88_14935 [Planctomycetes bacterium]|nr:hypothetical protein [Planctomycetota bacterium]
MPPTRKEKPGAKPSKAASSKASKKSEEPRKPTPEEVKPLEEPAPKVVNPIAAAKPSAPLAKGAELKEEEEEEGAAAAETSKGKAKPGSEEEDDFDMPEEEVDAVAAGNRPKDVVGPLGSIKTEVLVIARAKYSVATDPGSVAVSRPRKRDPKNPRTYRFTEKGMEQARRHLAGRSVTLADATELLRQVKVGELDGLEGEARKVATKFLLVALASRLEASLDKDGDLILVRVPFNSADLA